MNKEEKKKKEDEIDFMYNQSMTDGISISDESIMADEQDFGLEPFEEHDYENEIEDIYKDSKVVLSNMSYLYLDENEEAIQNSYVQKKIDSDARNLADMNFLQNITRKALITQMKLIDTGDVSPRNFETLYNGMREMRENIKQSTSTVNVMESFYKMLRNDIKEELNNTIGESDDDDSNIISQRDLNSQLTRIINKTNENEDK